MSDSFQSAVTDLCRMAAEVHSFKQAADDALRNEQAMPRAVPFTDSYVSNMTRLVEARQLTSAAMMKVGDADVAFMQRLVALYRHHANELGVQAEPMMQRDDVKPVVVAAVAPLPAPEQVMQRDEVGKGAAAAGGVDANNVPPLPSLANAAVPPRPQPKDLSEHAQSVSASLSCMLGIYIEMRRHEKCTGALRRRVIEEWQRKAYGIGSVVRDYEHVLKSFADKRWNDIGLTQALNSYNRIESSEIDNTPTLCTMHSDANFDKACAEFTGHVAAAAPAEPLLNTSKRCVYCGKGAQIAKISALRLSHPMVYARNDVPPECQIIVTDGCHDKVVAVFDVVHLFPDALLALIRCCTAKGLKGNVKYDADDAAVARFVSDVERSDDFVTVAEQVSKKITAAYDYLMSLRGEAGMSFGEQSRLGSAEEVDASADRKDMKKQRAWEAKNLFVHPEDVAAFMELDNEDDVAEDDSDEEFVEDDTEDEDDDEEMVSDSESDDEPPPPVNRNKRKRVV